MAEAPAPAPAPKPASKPAPPRRSFAARLRRVFTKSLSLFRRILGVPEPLPRARVYWDDDMAITLASLVRETETRASGKVQLISLADFRAAIGDLWDKYKERLLLIAETTIARRIGRGNTFIAHEDDSWLLLFPRISEAEAQARADAIATAIGEKLMGARFTLEEVPLPEAAKLDLTGLLNDDGSLDFNAVRGAIAKVKEAQKAPAPTAAAPPRKPPPPRPASAAPRPATARPPAAIPIVPRARAVPGAPVSDEPSEVAQYTLRFSPLWSLGTQSVDTFIFRAYDAHGSNVFDDETAFNANTALDLIKTALAAFSDMCKDDLPATFVLPVPITALGSKGVAEAQRLIAAVPREARLGHLRILPCRLPLRAVPERVGERLVALRELFRAHVRDVAFPIDLSAPVEAILALDHVSFACDVSRESARSDTEIFEALLQLKKRAGRRPVAVLGLGTPGHVARALAAGITELGGPAFLEDIKDLPLRLQLLNRDGLIASL